MQRPEKSAAWRARTSWLVLALSGPALLFLACLLLPACKTSGKQAPASNAPAPSLVWPPPPNPPRIAYVKSIRQPADVGIGKPALKRLAQWVTGSDASETQLMKPFGIALDENDNICVTDTGANTVVYFDRDRKKWHQWWKLDKLAFVSPVAIAKHDDRFFVADSALGSVIVFNEQAKLLFQITNNLERPSGLVISRDKLHVVDSLRHCVVTFSPGGRFISEFGQRGAAAGQFNYPTHIAADRQGMLYVTDSMNGRVQMFDAEGRFKIQLGASGDSMGQFSRPKGVAADGLGHVYVVDGLFDNVQVFDREGRFLLNLGEAGSNVGEFWMPGGIAISSDNEIFIADSYNHRIQVFKYVGAP